jgi:nitrile hydratase accessory protein
MSTDPSTPFEPGQDRVFAEPWEARIFAIVVALHQAGRFEWKDFSALLADTIRASEAAGHCEPYYEHWFEAAETLIERLGLVDHAAIDAEVEVLRPDDRTVHHRDHAGHHDHRH